MIRASFLDWKTAQWRPLVCEMVAAASGEKSNAMWLFFLAGQPWLQSFNPQRSPGMIAVI
jgi:hypothetical protein